MRRLRGLITGWKLDVRTMDGWWDEWIDVCMDIPFVVTTVFYCSDAGIR
jgi:hypothetical protein